MPLADYQEYLDQLKENRIADFQTTSTTRGGGRIGALWPVFLPVPPTPTASVALDSTSTQGIGPIPNLTSGQLSLLGGQLNTSGPSGVGLIVIDLLNNSGGLSGIITGSQTTNLPTTALTRYTNGEGVMAGIIIYTQIGATATTFTVEYTNSDGVSGSISTATTIGGTDSRTSRAFLTIPLQPGDKGVRSVESITLAATTGTAGNFGICLYKPLAMIPLNDVQGAIPVDAVSTGGFIGNITGINPNACISLLAVTNTAQTINGAIILGQV